MRILGSQLLQFSELDLVQNCGFGQLSIDEVLGNCSEWSLWSF
jgi:hypothetical protein